MDFKFDKGAAGDAPQGQDKGRQTILLVVLLLLLGGFGYLYFFTGLIRPQEQPAPPQPAPQVVKQPLPARDGAPAQPQAAAPGAAAPATPPTAAPAAKPAGEPVKPSTAPQAPQAQQQAPKAPVAAPAPAVPAKPAAPVTKPAEKQPAAPAVAKPAAPKPAPAPKAEQTKPAPAAKPAPAPTVAEKKASAPKPAAKRVEPAKTGGPWTLVVGSYVVEERLAADMAKVKGAGLMPVMTSGQRRMTTMHRLKVGEYADRAAAQQAIEQLKQKAGDGFAVQKGGKHEVFAGSYAQLESAQAEQQRLAAGGIKVTIQKSQVGVPSRKLTAGTFTDRVAAETALKKLKQAGIGTPVLE